MLRSSRLVLALLLLATATVFGTACDPPAALVIALPDGVATDDLPDAQRALLRATLEVGGGALAETEATLDVDARTVAGDFTLQNVTGAGERTATLRLYGRFDADAAELLLGSTDATLTVTPAQETRLSFNAPFNTCSAPGAIGDACALVFDENRNLNANIIDLLPVAAGGLGIDPAPQAPFVEVSPSTLQFPSGIRLGSFARQVIVLENRGAHPMRVVRAEVVGGQGVALSLFDPTGLEVQAPRRVLEGDAFGDTIAPTDEAFIAVSFAPVNSFLTTGAVHLVVQDTVTLVSQTARAKVIANADGALRPASPRYVDPDVATIKIGEGGDGAGEVTTTAFPAAPLFSGLAITGASTAQGGLARTGAVIVSAHADGAAFALPADAAFTVDVPAGHRFSTSLGGLASDVDLGVFLLNGDTLAGLACATCLSSNAGPSPESAELTNDSSAPLRVLVVLGRVDNAPLLAPPLVDFDLTAHVTQGPEFADDAPAAPSDGPLEGGVPVTLRGRGFDARATVTYADSIALDVVITTDALGVSTVSMTLPPGSLEVGKNPATIVVANPSVDDGGDGQAATLPEGFLYQPPAPRVTSVSPAFATTTGSGLPVVLEGAFFSTRLGAPVVVFGEGDDAIEVDAVFESAARILVTPPALPADAQDAPRTVALTVRNRLQPDVDGAQRLGAASNAREFSFVVPVGDPPTVSTVEPNNGTVDGGDVIVVTGEGFRGGATVFVDGAAAITDAPEEGGTRLQATAPAHAGGAAGAVDVVVVNDDGQAGALAAAFDYRIPAPSVTSVFPDRAVLDGGTLLVVSGTGFRDGVRVTFEGAGGGASAASVTRVSATTLLVLTPPADDGTAPLRVENVDDQRDTFATFAFFEAAGPAPQVVAVDPASGDVSGGYSVTVLGEEFTSGATVLFGGVHVEGDALTIVQGSGSGFDQVTFDAPAAQTGAAGAVSVQVVNDDQQSDGTTFSYVVAPASPRIDRVEPQQVSSTAPTAITIHGANLGDVVGVFTAGAPVTFQVVSSLAINATVPASPEGLLGLSVQTASGKVASTTIDVAGPPTVVGLSASTLHASVAGDQVLVFGTNLDAGALSSVRVAGLDANVLVVNEAFLLVEVPALVDTAQTSFTLTYQGGVVATSPDVAARAPRVLFVDHEGPDAQGRLTLTLFGDHLNADRLTNIEMTSVASNVSCIVQSKSESSVVCVNDVSLDVGAQYGLRLDYEAVFDGTTSEVSLAQPVVCTTSGCVTQ